jgi:Holliday junction resolvase RusA-like endonuclease
MTTLTITIPGRPPTANNRGNQGMQWAAAKRWRARAAQAALEARPEGWVPLERCNLVLEFVVPRKGKRDWDNLYGSTKPLTDGMKDAGIIAEDHTDVIVDVRFVKTYIKGVDATVYHFEALPLEQLVADL